MSDQLTIFFLFFGGLAGVLFSFFLIRKKLQRPGYIFLLLYFVVMLLQITLKLMSKGWLTENWHLIDELSYQLPLLFGPFIYLFTRQLLQRESFQWDDLFHFTPFAILVFFVVVGYSNAESPVVLFPYLLVKFRLVLQLVSIYLYHWFALQCLKNNAHYVDLVHQFKWLKKFIYASVFVCIAVAILNYCMVVLYPDLEYIRPGFLVLTLFIYWISYEALNHPEIFTVVKGYGTDPIPQAENLPKFIIHRSSKKYYRSNLGEEEANRIANSLQAIMRQQKPFLDPDLDIEQLALMVDSNRHHVSQVLNDKLSKSFYDFINYFRIEEARCLLTNPAKMNDNISSLAYDAGFNSLSTFNDVFRKCTGITPSQFKKQAEELSRKKRG